MHNFFRCVPFDRRYSKLIVSQIRGHAVPNSLARVLAAAIGGRTGEWAGGARLWLLLDAAGH
eukprot:6793500-Prymnesium_polylepis.1